MFGSNHQTFRFESDSHAAAHAREAVRALLPGLRADLLADVLLCVTELVTNSVTHADAKNDEPLALEVHASPSLLRVEITDRARGFESPRARRAALSEDEEERGWGLYIVELLADRWGVEPGELTRVWFEKDLG